MMSEIGDELEQLRVPFEKIKFGKKIEGHGYGSVFEGEFDHQRVVLKRINITNLAHIKPKLLAEILTISRFRQHPNLVALIGFCDEKSNEIILLYEYVSSGNLADKMRKRLTTIQRLEICLDAARGLDYLHTGVDSATPGIIHGDIKPSKLLLNSDSTSSKLEAKVSSFGLSKILPGKVQKTVDSSDPAFEVTGKVTKESDIYCFGVLLLEVLCGVPELVDTDDYQERHVTELVPKRLEQNRLRKIVHFDIRNEIKTESLDTYAKIACQCVIKNPAERPTMAQVVEELEKALQLQGGEVSYVKILGSRNRDGAPDEAAAGDDPKEDGNGAIMNSDTPEKDPEAETVRVEKNIDGLIMTSDLTGESNGDEDGSVGTSVHSRNAENDAVEEITMSMQEQSFPIPTLGSEGGFNEPDGTRAEDGPSKSDEAVTESTNDPKTIEEITDEQNPNEKSIISNDDTSCVSEDQVGDELDRLRIPLKKIKFGDNHGYGSVFEGEYDNQQVALKQISITNLKEIKAKLLTISRFCNHPNLVSLIGFCDEKSNEIILVYEYVSNGNLADKMKEHLTTIQRLEICLGAARGLDYLHTITVVHGDIKLSKVLLNSKLVAKLSSFGLSRLDPDKMSKESDVYYFGVLMLEALCGVSDNVTELLPKVEQNHTLRNIVHFDIRNEITTESLETYTKIACQCVIKNPQQRPTMAQVIQELQKALKLQGETREKGNGNGVPDETVDEKEHSNILEKEPESKTDSFEDQNIHKLMSEGKLDSVGENNADNNIIEDVTTGEEDSEIQNLKEQGFQVPILGSEDSDSAPVEYVQKEKGIALTTTVDDGPKSKDETIDDSNLNEKSCLIVENDPEKNIVNTSHHLIEKNAVEDIFTESQNSGTVGFCESEFLNLQDTEKKPEVVIELRESSFDDNLKPKVSESKRRSSSTSSESSNGDGTAPSDYLLHKSPNRTTSTKKPLNGSRNCCSCAWWRVFSHRMVSYGGLFWNKFLSFFTWIKSQFSHKHN